MNIYMKKNRTLLEVAILIGTSIPFIIVYFLKGKAPFIEFDKYLLGVLIMLSFSYFYPLYIYQKNLNRLSDYKTNHRFRLVWYFTLLDKLFLLHLIAILNTFLS
jgi:hypothetical protein